MLVDQRKSPRKILRGKGMLILDGTPAIAARTLDISASGLSVMVVQPLQMGQLGRITFEMYIDSKSHIITARASIAYCMFSGNEFKVGLQFVALELPALTAVEKYMR